jgi:sec-independent protein translocase protein TatB
MFDIGWTEIFVIGVVALVFLGPKELPRALYQLGRWTRAARKITGDFQRQVDQLVREAELEDVKKTVTDASKMVDIRKTVRNALDPVGDIRKAFEPPKFPSLSPTLSKAPATPAAATAAPATAPALPAAAAPAAASPAAAGPAAAEAPVAAPPPAAAELPAQDVAKV